jgi:hypothetical protein
VVVRLLIAVVVTAQVRGLPGMVRTRSAAFPGREHRGREKESKPLAEGAKRGRSKKKGRMVQTTGDPVGAPRQDE